MTVSRPGGLVIALTLALAAQVSYAVPARAMRELRAVSCCATHCGHATSANRAARCCQLSQDGGTTAVVAPGGGQAEAPAVALAFLAPALAAPSFSARLLGAHDRARGRAGPVFLLTQPLQL